MSKRNYLLSGLVASLLYTFTVVLGGWMWTGYSHAKQAISELSMLQAPNRSLMLILFTQYNILLMIFAYSIFKQHQNKLITVASILLFLVGLSGLMMNIFPQDPINSILSFQGLLHLVFAGVAALGTIFAIFFGGFGLTKIYGDKVFRFVSILLGSLVVIFGTMTPFTLSNYPLVFGVVERITIFSFIIWLATFSYEMFYRETRKT